METEYNKSTKILRLKLKEEIDHHSAELIRRKADYEIKKYMPKKVILDFDRVHFMDSSGIGMVVGRYKLVSMLGGNLLMENVGQALKRVFNMSGILKIIPITRTKSRRSRRIKMNELYENEMKLEFLSKSNNESFARITVAAFAAQLDPTIEELADIKTAVSEAVTNSIIHGYEEKEGIIKINAKIYCGGIQIEISDMGKGIEDIEKAREPLYTSKPNLERSGMGFTIMESFMDEIKIESIKGLGTKITMKKKIKKQAPIEEFGT